MTAGAQDLFVEAESFDAQGGWKLDTQFIELMGSPYLLAHGLGRPVADAKTQVVFPETGEYNVFVRTKDWVAKWKAPGAPGKFQLVVNGEAVEEMFGTQGEDWQWQSGGKVDIKDTQVELALHDLTGFDGRCDAIYFTKSKELPPNSSEILGSWRRKQLNLPEEPEVMDGYDLVVIGGGYSGMGSAISAARMGCKVALIQNRPVLGGNGSSEVRVWSMGLIRRGKYPRVGEIVTEFCDSATKSPGTFEEFEDAKKEEIVRTEDNIDLFLNHHAFEVETKDNKITAVLTFDTKTGAECRFESKLYSDCTGHGTIGYLAEAAWEMEPKGRMGMSNMWAWDEGEEMVEFPATPWALDLEMKDFPYPRDHHGQWFWEGGFDKDPINEAEQIRDWNLRAVYGAFNAMKNGDGAADHKTAYLTWIAYIGGPRESRRLMGDIVLTQDDVVEKVDYPDGCVPSTWSIDLHYPKEQYATKFPDNPFISKAVHDRRIDRSFGYPVPYRCFYSRNIENLFMAGRCISVTHQALGTTRVMKTCGMMGEVVGRAASICVANDCSPRDVYAKHWAEMDKLLQLPGKARRETVDSEMIIPEDALDLAGANGPMTGLDPKKLGGVVVDDREANKKGKWTEGTGLKGYVAWGYSYASAGSGASVSYLLKAPKAGTYEVLVAHQPHPNRGDHVAVDITTWDQTDRVEVNMKKAPKLKTGFSPIAKYTLAKNEKVKVVIQTENSGGTVHADAIQLIEVKP
ncbi:MAG: FAD-dependent oxidoreductase [Planctomycetota bacterium]